MRQRPERPLRKTRTRNLPSACHSRNPKETVQDEMRGIMGTRRCFGMKLDRSNAQVLMLEASQGLVIQIDVGRNTTSSANPLGIHTETMVLAGDFHPTCFQVAHRMVCAPMTKAHFKGIGTQSTPEQLMAQAIPTIGFFRTTFLISATKPSSAAGSPGPLLKNTKSLSFIHSSADESQGKTSTRRPASFSKRRMFCFTPPSTTATEPMALFGSAYT